MADPKLPALAKKGHAPVLLALVNQVLPMNRPCGNPPQLWRSVAHLVLVLVHRVAVATVQWSRLPLNGWNPVHLGLMVV